MKTSVEQLEGTNIKLTVTVPASEVDRAIAETYAEFAKQVRIPGFRAGKAPRPVIDTHIGRDRVLAEALEALVSDTYPEAVHEESLRPVDRPEFDELDGIEAGKDYTYTALVELRPELTLSSTDDLKVTVPPSKATDREIDAQIDYMRQRFATLEPVADRGAEKGDFILLSFVGRVDGEEYEGNSVDKYLYETGRGQMPDEFEDALVGAKAGDEVHVEFAIPDTTNNADFIGKTATFDITIHEVKAKVLPELDDELAGNLGHDSFDEMRTDIREKIDQSKVAGHMQAIESASRRLIAERLTGEVPESMVRVRTQNMLEEFAGNLESRNMTLESYVEATGISADDIQRDIEEQAKRAVAEELALEALAREKGLEVVDGDIDRELEDLAGAENDPEEMRERFRRQGALPILKEQILRRFAVRWLMDNVEAVEEDAEAPAETEEPKAAKPKKPRAKKAKAEAEPEAQEPTVEEEQ